MAGQGQQVMTQAQLNLALNWACSQLSDPARAEELLGRGADQHALVEGWNVLHVAASHGRAATVNMLLDKGAVLEARGAEGNTACSGQRSGTKAQGGSPRHKWSE